MVIKKTTRIWDKKIIKDLEQESTKQDHDLKILVFVVRKILTVAFLFSSAVIYLTALITRGEIAVEKITILLKDLITYVSSRRVS